ncbi:DUF2460 domain-containing protein [Sphingorhabdus arenilitoris]|uniref:DUF2460 domain-containing protein n=1 Tax=Sphingorhabdus arenilitoris TaxID=1490041 RepID=A0ABV8RDS5_9SPHN
MAYWLCEQRGRQQTVPVMRFDPRFWTVNFPRPMMASVVTSGPESLRVDATFYKNDDLAGLIWDSEDRIDHPLLAYETNRDYRRLTLSFRWRSAGIMPLNAVNGPTLTIEGRDAAGKAKSWYVRLWNYASGSPSDAQITLKFSKLNGGFLLPSEADPVYAGDIDRMFISLIPPEFGSGPAIFPGAKEGWVELSQIRCDGGGVMLDTGDVMLPEHRLKMATGYDDAYNQTPARMLRQIHALGYRGTINHYVGMSHYFRLEPLGNAHYVSLAGGTLNTPCRAWHDNFADQAKQAGYDLIFSLSYELFDAHCWNDWKQRAENGDPALTGWVPPSTLLSPAHNGAMAYLQLVGRAFADILKQAGLPVKFQIGEPWWWIMPDGRICLYDAAASVAFGTLSVSIGAIPGPKTAAQKAMLDKAGELLSASTAALAAAVRAEAGAAGAQLLLLVYLPTVLDPEAPEAQRANVPLGWATPAFDVLQLEDYDWVISGNHGATERAIPAMAQRLGYPIEEQHYFSGFVLNAPEKAQWRDIEEAAQRAHNRGTAETYIWALPQICRDGYTHFEIGEETQDVQAFDDILFPIEIGAQASAMPEFSTQIATTLSGHERRNSDWADARQSYDVAPGIGSDEQLEVLIGFFRARRGAAKAFRFRDSFDNSSNAMTLPPTLTDQILGEGDGVRTSFALLKRYGDGEAAQMRLITRPVAGSVRVAINGQEATSWRVEQGRVIFETAPNIGAVITAGFHFDVPVRFAEDRLEVNRFSFGAGEMPSVPLIEVKEAG